MDRRSNIFEFSDRQLGQSWVSVALRVADNTDGHSNLLSVVKPFHALDARRMAGGFVFDDDRRGTLYILGDEAAEYRHERTNFSTFGGWSSGLHGGWVKRWTVGGVYDDNRFSADRDALIYTLTGNRGFGSMERKALLLTANIRGRREDGRTANATATVIACYYSRQSEKRMFFARFSATAGQNLDLDNPIEIGGDTGLRGYPLRYQSGDGRVLVTVEQRYFTDWYPFRLFRIGGAVFFDVGRTYGDNPLSGPNPGWLKDVGFGFRFVPTRFGIRKVIHVDVAFPLDGDPTIDSVQILLAFKRSF